MAEANTFDPLFFSNLHWSPGGPLDQWIGAAPGQHDYAAIYQLTLVVDKVDALDGLEQLVDKHKQQPFILVRLAEIYEILQHVYGARRLVDCAASFIKIADPIFERWASDLRRKSKIDKERQVEMYKNPNMQNVMYASAPGVPSLDIGKEPDDISSTIRQKWKDLSLTMSNEEITAAYARLLCIETNEIEGVFCLGGQSLIRLVRGGFFIGAIQHVDPNSNIKNKEIIIQILNDVQAALCEITKWANNKNTKFTANFIMSIHARVISSDRIRKHFDNITKISYRVLVPINEWRHKTVYARHTNGCIMFYPFDKVPVSMEEYISYMQPIFDDLKNHVKISKPYILAAWLHHAFVSIHPFEDGNGRTTRLICSIPLVFADLPPICVLLKNKGEYIALLQVADKTGNISPLAEFFAKESLLAIETIKNAHITSLDAWEDDAANFRTLSTPFASYMDTSFT